MSHGLVGYGVRLLLPMASEDREFESLWDSAHKNMKPFFQPNFVWKSSHNEIFIARMNYHRLSERKVATTYASLSSEVADKI